MPAITLSAVFQDAPMTTSDNVLLFTTLAFALISFLASSFTTLRTLLPLLPPHPLHRRTTGSSVGPYSPPPQIPAEKPKKLKSAQRFSVWLAILDVAAVCVLVWESAYAASSTTGLGGTRGGASRLYVACAARPTLLMIVAVVSYVNVVHGRSISLGPFDCIVWGPALAILALGAGLAATGHVGGQAVWIGLIAWLSFVTLTVTLCFGRLLIAILRVRKLTQRQADQNSPWQREQDRYVRTSTSTYRGNFLPPLHSNFSGLTTSFIGTSGQSNASVDDLSHSSNNDVVTFMASNVPVVGYAPSRPSTESEHHNLRDFRSPTPGSTHNLLSARWNEESLATISPKPDHQAISFEEIPRPSFGSYASATTAGGFVGNTAVRQAITREVWGDTPPPGSGGPKVELSQKEARGAIVRIGGHLASCLIGYALVCPFMFMRLVNPSQVPPLAASIAVILSICQSGLILATQCWLSEGFWFKYPQPPVLTSSSAATLERYHSNEKESVSIERAESRESTLVDPMPGIRAASIDCDEGRRSRMGRAMSMAQTHPKLMILPTNATSSTTSGFAKGATTSGHARLRSLTLAKTSVTSLHRDGRGRSGSTASRTTLAGYEHHKSMSYDKENSTRDYSSTRSDELLTKALLASKKQSWSGGSAKIPFGFGSTNGATRPRSATVDTEKRLTPSPSPITPVTGDSGDEFGFRTREFTLSPSTPKFPPSAKTPPPTDYTIDFLSSQLLPRLVPSVKFGSKTPVDPEGAPLRQPPRSDTEEEKPASGGLGFGTAPSGRHRNYMNLSLPGMLHSNTWSAGGKSTAIATELARQNEAWIEVEEAPKFDESPLVAVTQTVRGVPPEDKSLRRRSLKDRSSKAWDALEAEQAGKSSAVSHSASNLLDGTKFLATPQLPPESDETEILQEEDNFADGEPSAEEDQVRYSFDDQVLQTRRSASPLFATLSPPSAALRFTETTEQPRSYDSGDVILCGSRALDDDEEELGTVQCATVRPVSRLSTASLSSSSTNCHSPPPLRPPSRADMNSSASSHSRSTSFITSQGFANLMEQGSTFDSLTDAKLPLTLILFSTGWHGSEDDAPVVSSDDYSSGEERMAPRRSSVLSTKDSNARSLDISSASESDGKGKPRKERMNRRRSSILLDPPPIPPTIDEADEDKRSGTPTPRASRSRRVEDSHRDSLPTHGRPLTSTPPPGRAATVTPPAPNPTFVTTRNRSKQQQGATRRSSRLNTGKDENVAPRATPLASGLKPIATGGERSVLRGMR